MNFVKRIPVNGLFDRAKGLKLSWSGTEVSKTFSSMKTSIFIKLNTLFKGYMQTRIDVYETLCPQQMLVHKGGKIKNWGGECRDVTPTKLQSQNIFEESTGGVGLGGGGGQDGCE